MNDRELMNKAIDSRLAWDEVSRRMTNAGRRLQAEEMVARCESLAADSEAEWAYNEWMRDPEARRAECEAIDAEIRRAR